jgi:hypothetical protein
VIPEPITTASAVGGKAISTGAGRGAAAHQNGVGATAGTELVEILVVTANSVDAAGSNRS